MVLRIAFGVLAKFELNAKHEALLAGLAKLPTVLTAA